MTFKAFYLFIRKTLSDMTIRRKLISIIMLACTCSLLLVGAVFIIWQWFSLRQSMVRSLSTQAKVIADNCTASVAFTVPQDADDVLKSLRAEPSIVFGGVYTIDRTIFASYYRDGQDPNLDPGGIKMSGYVYDNKLLTVYEPITMGEKDIGVVCLRSTLSNLYGVLKRDVAVVVGALLLVSLLIYFVSFELQKIISVPIVKLADVAKVVSEKKEYSIRVDNDSKDEVGLLIEAFNEMLSQIQQRDYALVNTNEQLEKKVEERTVNFKDEVSVRKKAEYELAETVKKLMVSNKELREFTRIAAHDLQTPLRGIGVLSDWISEDYARKFDNEGRVNAKMLVNRAKRMSRFLNAMIKYSGLSLIDRQQGRLDLNIVLSEVIASIKIPDNIEIIIENRLPVFVGVRKFMHELFENLLTNAIKYIDKPKGYIKIACQEDGDFWEFSVADNGVGIEKKYFAKVFQIFQILSLRDETEDIGIGLSIVKKIVELYDGHIWIESQPGQGTTFFFTILKPKVEVTDYVEAEVGLTC